ncbi:basic amino acid ABC transporter substrate-binding protein [Actinomadura sp. NBRC 104425]|uniref:ABC transporter substrate-binding protein n=1 Tax=Actinomadura sp. NBRC 104425 TaxID=3032204 RepID=UPI0024A2982C|nr:ABC transporter substrate-binding protein [Actinomadura sp. NBRC 104425]GLZ10410.1 basic amino acid ABC transporter substrate-binding protein [Actinomadura sp. NBRC 104425]
MSGASPWRPVLGAVLAALALAAAACGGDGATVQGVELVAKGRLTTCAQLPYPPFETRQGGRVVGFDVDMLDLVARRLGVTQRVVEVPFATMTNGEALDAQRCDVVMGAMAVTPERTERMDASKPYFDAAVALVVEKGSGITSLQEVEAGGLRLGTQSATAAERYVEDGDFDDPRSYDDPQTALKDLRAGKLDAVVLDYPAARNLLRTQAGSGVEITATPRTGERYAFWVRKNRNPALVRLIDQVIDRARADGTYDRLYRKWIGPLPDAGRSAAAR